MPIFESLILILLEHLPWQGTMINVYDEAKHNDALLL